MGRAHGRARRPGAGRPSRAAATREIEARRSGIRRPCSAPGSIGAGRAAHASAAAIASTARGSHGRVPRAFGPSLLGSSSYARRAHSTSSGRVSRGSMISSTPNASAVSSGERSDASFASSSRAQRVRIGRRFELSAVRRLDAALDRQRAPLAARPRVAEIQAVVRAVARARDAEHAPHDDRAPRHARLVDRGERAHAVADRAALLGLDADLEARVVDEVHDRQVERVAEVDEADHLLRRVGVDRAAALARIVREHADRDAVEPRERRHERPP